MRPILKETDESERETGTAALCQLKSGAIRKVEMNPVSLSKRTNSKQRAADLSLSLSLSLSN